MFAYWLHIGRVHAAYWRHIECIANFTFAAHVLHNDCILKTFCDACAYFEEVGNYQIQLVQQSKLVRLRGSSFFCGSIFQFEFHVAIFGDGNITVILDRRLSVSYS